LLGMELRCIIVEGGFEEDETLSHDWLREQIYTKHAVTKCYF